MVEPATVVIVPLPIVTFPPALSVPAPVNTIRLLAAKVMSPETLAEPVEIRSCPVLFVLLTKVSVEQENVPASTDKETVPPLLLFGELIVVVPETLSVLVLSVKLRAALLPMVGPLRLKVVQASVRPVAIVTVNPLGMLAVSDAPGKLTPAWGVPVWPHVAGAFQFPLADAVKVNAVALGAKNKAASKVAKYAIRNFISFREPSEIECR